MKMNIINKMVKEWTITFLSLCLFTFLPLQVLATDYVDDINNAAGKREAGRQVIYEMNVGSFTPAGTFAAAQQQFFLAGQFSRQL